MTTTHRTGPLHQSNKRFKARHATKSQLKGHKTDSIKKSQRTKVQSRHDRRNAARLAVKSKKSQQQLASQQLETARRIVLAVPMSGDVDVEKLMDCLSSAQNATRIEAIPSSSISIPSNRIITVAKKHTVQVLAASRNANLLSLVDAAQTADFIMLVYSAVVEADTEKHMEVIQAIGVPTIIPVVQYLESVDKGNRIAVRKSLDSYTRHYFPNALSVLPTDSPSEATAVLRMISEKIPVVPMWKESRAFMIPDRSEWIKMDGEDVVVVSGYARGGARFDANRLVHIPNLGDFQVCKITSACDTYKKAHVVEEGQVISVPGEERDDLLEENPEIAVVEEEVVEEDMKDVEMQVQVSVKKRVPKGTSEYQSAWIISDSEIDSDAESAKQESAPPSEDEEPEEIEMSEDEAQEESEDEIEDQLVPDHVRFPREIPARERFRKYRYVESIRRCEWDQYENLPLEYSKLFQLAPEAEKQLLTQSQLCGIEPGQYITLWIKSVPMCEITAVFGLHQHEHKRAEVSFEFQATRPLESKKPVIVQIGVRRELLYPIYSEISGSKNNVHKFQKRVEKGAAAGTALARVGIGRVIVFSDEGIAAAGHVSSSRVIVKKAVIAGKARKIHKRSAVIKGMFYNPSDITWFKRAGLETSSGKRGHISESLGTHGLFKARFSGQLMAHDVVSLSLYKRVFPKSHSRI